MCILNPATSVVYRISSISYGCNIVRLEKTNASVIFVLGLFVIYDTNTQHKSQWKKEKLNGKKGKSRIQTKVLKCTDYVS